MKKSGKQYELLTQKIYQALLNYDDMKSDYHKIDVKHNVKLKGRSGNTHQIDVYWEFELAGVVYKTIIEVKDWENEVKQMHLHAFKTVIDDIPGAVSGIFVSRNGFQKGAKIFADSYGIKLVQLTEEAGEFYIRIRITNTTTNYEMAAICVDEECEVEGIPFDVALKLVQKTDLRDVRLLNPGGNEVLLYKLMCMEAVPYYSAPEGEHHKIDKTLSGNWYFVGEDGKPIIKVLGYRFECYNTISYAEVCATLKNLLHVYVQDIIKNSRECCLLLPHGEIKVLKKECVLPTIYKLYIL